MLHPVSHRHLAVVCLLTLLSACGQHTTPASASKEVWDDDNNPLNLSHSYQRLFSELPLSGKLATIPWADSYWPSSEAGISFRWNTARKPRFAPRLYTQKEVAELSPQTLASLSPAEKYDILLGNYDYPLVQIERERTSPKDPEWEGICHGWAAAALNFTEPKAVTMRSADGIDVPFGSSDIKALLSYYQGEITDEETLFLGMRCESDLSKHPRSAKRPECRDVNAGAFHLVLANQIGLMGEGFVADVVRDAEVWNHPIYQFRSKVLDEREPSDEAARGTVREILLETKMTYTVEVEPQWEKVAAVKRDASETATYRYWLELNKKGKVLGGSWESEERPDFLYKQARPAFKGYFRELGNLYESATSKVRALPNPR